MTELLHMTDNYIKRFESKILEVLENGVVLERTAFYPLKGGVQNDIGMLVANGKKYNVTGVFYENEKVVHKLESTEGLEVGMKVNGEIDWNRRYRLMRLHTAAHLLEAMMYKKTKCLIGSGKVSIDSSYMGFTIEQMDRALIESAVEDANRLIDKGANVIISFMDRERAMQDPEIVKLAMKLPPQVKKLRIVTIEGIDHQACGGPHVSNIDEIGRIEIVKIANKGKGNRRLYYSVI